MKLTRQQVEPARSAEQPRPVPCQEAQAAASAEQAPCPDVRHDPGRQQSVKGESKFKFLELYAGFKGLSMAMADVVGESVEVLKPLELYDGWDVLTPEGLEEARKAAREADHLHVAIPCRSYTRARRVDAHGAVATVRSDERPEGWGHPVAEKGNRHLEAIEIILMEAARSGCTISIENPWNSFLWETAKMKKLAKRLHLVPVYLEQCAYGGMSRKPTRILTDAEWMQTVQLTCSQVRPHCHSKLEGKVWDPVTQSKVWKTSKAAEYPSGLCRAWAMALKDYLQAKPLILQKKTYEKVGAHQHALVLDRSSWHPAISRGWHKEDETPHLQGAT